MFDGINLGVGVDIETIDRFKKYIKPINERLMKSIFTQTELDYCFSTNNPASHLAVRFAAKEAIIKAFYSIKKTNINYNIIEINKTETGVPFVKFLNDEFRDYLVKLSLSHSKNNAVAFVIILEWKNDQ